MRYRTRAPRRQVGPRTAAGGLVTVLATVLGVVLLDASPAYARDDFKVTAESGCEGLTVTITNTATSSVRRVNRSTTYRVRADGGGFDQTVTVASHQSQSVLVPPDTAKRVYVSNWRGRKGPYSWEQPAGCGAAADGADADAEVTAESTCSSLKLTITNPGDADLPVRIEYGKTPRDVSVPAKDQQIVELKAAQGVAARVLAGGRTWELPYEEPLDCTTAPPVGTANAGSGGGITGLYIIGGLLIVVGILTLLAAGQGKWDPLVRRAETWWQALQQRRRSAGRAGYPRHRSPRS